MFLTLNNYTNYPKPLIPNNLIKNEMINGLSKVRDSLATAKDGLHEIVNDPFWNQKNQVQRDQVVETERIIDKAIKDIDNVCADLLRN